MAIPNCENDKIKYFSHYMNMNRNTKLNKDEDRKTIKENLSWIQKSLDDITDIVSSYDEIASFSKDDEQNLKEKETSCDVENSNELLMLSKEVEIMKLKAIQPIPKAIIIYIILSTMGLTVFTTILIIMVKFKIKILDLESCIIGILSTIGLLATSIVAIKDWRKFVKNV